MLISLLSFTILSITMVMYMSSNPLSMGIMILAMATVTTLIMSMMMSSWLCFLVFLIYVSGMLVLFSYFVAITPNVPMPSLTMNITFMVIMPMLLMMLYMFPSTTPMSNQPELFMSFLYQYPSNLLLITAAIILLLTMIIVVKLISFNKGPLRPFN